MEGGAWGNAHYGYIPLGEGGRQHPLFVIECQKHRSLLLDCMAEGPRATFPVFGLKIAGAEVSGSRSIKELAAQVLEAIRSIQPSGPYRFATSPQCIRVGMEVEAQFAKGENEVEFVGLITEDAYRLNRIRTCSASRNR